MVPRLMTVTVEDTTLVLHRIWVMPERELVSLMRRARDREDIDEIMLGLVLADAAAARGDGDDE